LLLAALPLLLFFPADPAQPAETPLAGDAFEAIVAGRTYVFEEGGLPYGVERYLPGRRVIWAFDGGPCREGSWTEAQPGLICFLYDHDGSEHCWRFFDRGGGTLGALFDNPIGEGDAGGMIRAVPTDAPMICPGPDTGV
jgi:hypothetical protein